MSVRPTGLPPTARMRHDNHYVEEITSRGGLPVGRMIPIEELEPDVGQPRKDAGDLQRLTDSIREKGVLNPLLVRFLPDSGKYGIISGQRRYHAARAAGLGELPCIEKDVDDTEAIEIALTENLHHKELTTGEEAIWIHELAARLCVSHEEVARRVGKLTFSSSSSCVDLHAELEKAEIQFLARQNMDSPNDAAHPTEAIVTPERLASEENQSTMPSDAVAEGSATPAAVGREQFDGVAEPDGQPSSPDSELVCATERLLEEAKTSILRTVGGIASGLEDELKRQLKNSQQKTYDFRETGARELIQFFNEELTRQRNACIQELQVQSDNVVRDAVSRIRAETEEIVRAGCAKVSNQLESTTVSLRECERHFQASTKADAQETVDAFRKQVNLLADEILGKSRQAVVSGLEDLRHRIEKAFRYLPL